MFAYTKTLIDTTNLVFKLARDEMLDLQSASYNTSGAIALACNDLKLGLEYNTKFHDIQRRIFAASGIETTKLAASFSELGMAYLLNDHSSDDVLDLFKKSEAIRRRLPGFTEANLYNTLRGRGYTYLLRNDLEKAYLTFSKAMRNLKAQFGDEHLKMSSRYVYSSILNTSPDLNDQKGRSTVVRYG
jgi:tetratricopeptide (TPR) repeat protein